MISNCLNLCDIILRFTNIEQKSVDEILNECGQYYRIEDIERIYIGSYYCSNYFMGISDSLYKEINDKCLQDKMKISLVVPIVMEKKLALILSRINELCEKYSTIDEIVVNDFGMYSYLLENSKCNISLGRLLMKDPRDARIKELRDSRSVPKYLNKNTLDMLESEKVVSVDIENIYTKLDLQNVPEDIAVAIHGSYIYMSVGQNCLYSSIGKPDEKKYKADRDCSFQCMQYRNHYKWSDASFMRMGRAVFISGQKSNIMNHNNLRKVIWPIELWKG